MDEQSNIIIKWLSSILSLDDDESSLLTLEDLSDGVLILRLVEKLTHFPARTSYSNPTTQLEMVENVKSALFLIERKFGRLHGVDAEDVVSGDVLIILGLLQALQTASESAERLSQTISRKTQVLRKQTAKIHNNVNFTIQNKIQTQPAVRISLAVRPNPIQNTTIPPSLPPRPKKLQKTTQLGPNHNLSQSLPVLPPKHHGNQKPLSSSPKNNATSFYDLSSGVGSKKNVHQRQRRHRPERSVCQLQQNEIMDVIVDGPVSAKDIIGKSGVMRINEKVYQINDTFYSVVGIKDDDNVLEELVFTPKRLREHVVACARQILVEHEYYNAWDKYESDIDEISDIKNEKSIILIQSVIRKHFIRRTADVQGMSTRKFTVMELTSSEELYVENIKILRSHYLVKLLSYKEDPLLRNCLKDLDMIISFNDTLLKKLLMYKKNRNVYARGFAKDFIQFTEFLKSYTTYVGHQAQISSDIYSKSQKSKSFAGKLKELTLDPIAKNQPIFSYLILPVQRIPRYELFIKQLCKNMPNHHPERADLLRSLRSVIDVNKRLNETRRTQDDINLVQFISQRITLKKVNLSQDKHRRLVYSGFLRLQGHPKRFNLRDLFPERSQLVLIFNDLLLVVPAVKPTKVIDDNPTMTLLNSGKFKCNYAVPLLSTSYIDYGTNRFFLISDDFIFLFACDLLTEKQKWASCIDDCYVKGHAPLVARSAKVCRQNGLTDNELDLPVDCLPDFESMAMYHDRSSGKWVKRYIMLLNSLLCIYEDPYDAHVKNKPLNIINVSTHVIRSPAVCSRPGTFEISFRYEVHHFCVKDDEIKSLWLVALRSAFAKFNVAGAVDKSKMESLPVPILDEPLALIPESPRTSPTVQFLKMLLIQPSNRICADCLSREVSMADLDYGVFVCGPCGSTHMKLGHRILKKGGVPVLLIKQLLDFPLPDLQRLHTFGNLRGSAHYLKLCGSPAPSNDLLKNSSVSFMAQWITKKYIELPS
ncbi:Protein with RhoGEF and ArfGAP domains [Entamoeba marina]